jgi:hypothetical protein
MLYHLTTHTIERFWRYVEIGPGCWLWTGAHSSAGYGAFGLDGGTMIGAHQLAYYLATGEKPNDLFVCHTCDTPACVRPAHLFAGTQAANMADKVRKGRQYHPIGEKNRMAKLCAEDVLAIRARYANGDDYRDIAGDFRIHPYYVHDIASRRRWAHI